LSSGAEWRSNLRPMFNLEITMNRSFLTLLISCLTLLTALPAVPFPQSQESQTTLRAAETAETSQPGEDVIAKVGDQSITWGEVNTMLNSSAIVGLSIPAVGTRERDRTLILLLDRFISANLIYLDARKQGLDKDPTYQRDMQRFENAMLSDLYRRREMVGKITVSDQEIRDYFQENQKPGSELTDDVRYAIEATLRRQKMKERMAEASKHLRDGVQVVVHEENLSDRDDAKRPDTAVLAEIDGVPLTWGETKDKIVAAGEGAIKIDPLAMPNDARRAALETQIDLRIVAQRARAAGLDKDRTYQARVTEYRKSHLVNLHRDQLIAAMEPDKEQLQKYYEANKARLVQPETRKVQMVVVKTRDEAEDLKKELESGAMTMYQAAQKYSIAPKAKQDLGEIGWVNKGQAVPALDAAIFDAGPGEIGGPVATSAGWHLVAVQDVREAQYDDFDDPATQKLTRNEYLDKKLGDYVVNLRENDFPVVVYQDVLVRLSQREADAVAKLAEQARQPGSLTEQRVKELQKLMKP
jgi:peptidyl-prolyl cis-trans isomerase C